MWHSICQWVGPLRESLIFLNNCYPSFSRVSISEKVWIPVFLKRPSLYFLTMEWQIRSIVFLDKALDWWLWYVDPIKQRRPGKWGVFNESGLWGVRVEGHFSMSPVEILWRILINIKIVGKSWDSAYRCWMIGAVICQSTGAVCGGGEWARHEFWLWCNVIVVP